MVRYRLLRNFLNWGFCDYVAENYKNTFEYTPEHGWQAYTCMDEEMKKRLSLNFSSILPKNHEITWINVSVYHKDVVGLRKHTDNRSNRTFVGEISTGYSGGRFMLGEDTYIELNKGDVLVFNGGNTPHGVEQVTDGTRLSLNIWTETKTLL